MNRVTLNTPNNGAHVKLELGHVHRDNINQVVSFVSMFVCVRLGHLVCGERWIASKDL